MNSATATTEIRTGHVLSELAKLEPESVSCCVTSPPYWSLRKYDAPDAVWGDQLWCPHPWGWDEETDSALARTDGGYSSQRKWQHGATRDSEPEAWGGTFDAGGTCPTCGAWKGQYGLEPTPELYVEHTLEVLRAIRRVLRSDGVVWWNIGDSYAASPPGKTKMSSSTLHGAQTSEKYHETLLSYNDGQRNQRDFGSLKPKDLVLMPERVALAAQQDGWWVRKRIVWSKPNAMPESCTDRPTSAHETIWMLTKSARYWYDQEAVREGYAESSIARISQPTFDQQQGVPKDYGVNGSGTNPNRSARKTLENFAASHKGSKFHTGKTATHQDGRASEAERHDHGGRNMRDVWTFPTAQTPEAHFATFPEELPRRCILASCPREVCATCGHARERVLEPDFTDVPTHLETKRAPVDRAATATYLRKARAVKGLSRKAVDDALGTVTLYSWFEGRPAGIEAPTPEQWTKLKTILGLDDRFDEQIYSTVQVETTDHTPQKDWQVRTYGKTWNATSQTTGWTDCDCDPADGGPDYQPGVTLDPFLGIGTTGVVARRLQRGFVGIELSEQYAAIAERKIALALHEVKLAPQERDKRQGALPL